MPRVLARPGKFPHPRPGSGAPAPALGGPRDPRAGSRARFRHLSLHVAATLVSSSTLRFLIVSVLSPRERRRETSPRSITSRGSSSARRVSAFFCGPRVKKPRLYLTPSSHTHPLPEFLPLASRPWEDEFFKPHPLTRKGEGCPGERTERRNRGSLHVPRYSGGAPGRSPSSPTRDGGREAQSWRLRQRWRLHHRASGLPRRLRDAGCWCGAPYGDRDWALEAVRPSGRALH